MYINRVYEVDKMLASVTDMRKRKSVKIRTTLLIVLVGFILQKSSFYQIFTQSNFKKRMKNLFSPNTHIPQVDAARDILESVNPSEITAINDFVAAKIQKNKTFLKGTIGGYVVAGIDGMELFSSKCKHCDECLTRQISEEATEYFHRSVVCMSVGSDPHIIFGQDMLKPRDGSGKDEGELTGAKRLIETLCEKYNRFADVIVGDALYLNAPFINTVLGKKMDVVIRVKDKNRLIVKDALGIFKNQPPKKTFKSKKNLGEVWDESNFNLEGVAETIRFLQFKEHTALKNGKIRIRTVWVATTLLDAPAKTIWEIMGKRWDIENNGFHQLKTYYNADHCFEYKAVEVIFLLNILAFNLREVYLFRQVRYFRARKETRINVTQNMNDDLLLEDHSSCFCFNYEFG